MEVHVTKFCTKFTDLLKIQFVLNFTSTSSFRTIDNEKKVLCFSETPIIFKQSPWRNVIEDLNLCRYHCEIFKCDKFVFRMSSF